jgi:energy-coupling factor transporter ATP-binding protein EcfA2
VTYRLHGVTVTSAIALPGVRRATARGRPSIAISVDHLRPHVDETVDFFHHWRIRGTRGRPWLSIGRRQGDYVLRFPNLADFDISAAGDRIVCRPAPRLAGATLRHLLLDQALPLALSRSGNLVLHASAVHIPGAGCAAFVGPTGSGKSTLATALGLLGCPVVTDDCLVVEAGRGGQQAVPGYPGLRLWRDAALGLGLARTATASVAHYTAKRRLASAVRFRSQPSPLAVLFVLGRRRRKRLPTLSRALASRDRLMALAPYTYLMDVADRRQLLRMFRGLSTLVTQVPVVWLNVRDSRRRLLGTADEIRGFVRALSTR